MLLFSPEGNQRALAHRLAEHLPIAAIIVCQPPPPRQPSLSAKIGRLARGMVGLPLRKAWFGMLGHYERRFTDFPKKPALTVADINDPAVHAVIASIEPDLAIVSGTNLLKQPLIEAIGRTGTIINLHTGISPYVRGAPNCTNWCLATGRFDLIGNTVMWIDEGIDSGNLIATEQTPLDRTENLTQLHIKVMDHAHDLLVRCTRRWLAGKNLPNVPQREVGSGNLFLNRHWNARAAAKAVVNFYLHYRRRPVTRASPLKLVSPTKRPSENSRSSA